MIFTQKTLGRLMTTLSGDLVKEHPPAGAEDIYFKFKEFFS